MANSDADRSTVRAARITAAVAIIVALAGVGAGVGATILVSDVQAPAAHTEFDRTNRLQAYARFNDAERDLQRISATYAAVVVRGVVAVDFRRVDDLYEQAEASYAAVGKALADIRVVGSEEMKVIAERLRATERRRLDALYVDPHGGVMVGLPADGPIDERQSAAYERTKSDADRSYDQFIKQVGQELTAR